MVLDERVEAVSPTKARFESSLDQNTALTTGKLKR
jgi:hypothetical protein